MLYEMKRAPRRADPYRDTDLIDERAPRFNQVVVGHLSLVAVLTGWWWLLALLALQLALGLTLGRRWCLACVFYFEVLQPRFGEGRLEDARPPRFANMVGLGVLGTASLAYGSGSRRSEPPSGSSSPRWRSSRRRPASAPAAPRTSSATG